ncbi:MAG: response regulator [Deltaproteobacteria bacterium]|nr:response regulator [Deltaproteobacteria bacterium]
MLDMAEIKILVADDFGIERRLIVNFLSKLGFHDLIEVGDGAEALRVLSKTKVVDLVISDWRMPRMSGLDLVTIMRKTEGLKQIPVLMITAEHQYGKVLEAVEAGVSNYIVKPFTIDILAAKIKKIFQKLDRVEDLGPVFNQKPEDTDQK